MSSPFTAQVHHARLAICRLVRGIGLAVSAGALALSVPASAAEPPLTLSAALQRAVERSRQLAAKDFAVAAAREMAVAAGQLPDPVLKAGVDNLPVNGTDRFSFTNDFMTMRRIGVMQELTGSDKRRFRSERYAREAEKGLAEKTMTIAAIQRDTALAWLDVYYTQAAAAVLAEQKTQSGLEVQAAEGAYRAGRGSQADVFAARSAAVAIDDRISEIERRLRNAKTMLARWVGDAAHAPLAGKPAIDRIRLDPATLDTQLAHHPEIAVLAKQEEIAAAEAKLAQANRHADWSVEVAYQQRGPAFSNMVSVGVSIPLQWDRKNRQDRELSSKLAMVEQAKAEREDMLREHVAQTRAMIAEWQNGIERQTRYEKEMIPLANERTLATTSAYRGDKAALAEVLTARRNEIDVRLQTLQIATETARLWAQLNYLFPEGASASHAAPFTGRNSQ